MFESFGIFAEKNQVPATSYVPLSTLPGKTKMFSIFFCKLFSVDVKNGIMKNFGQKVHRTLIALVLLALVLVLKQISA